MLKSSGFLHTLSEKLPDDRPITALQVGDYSLQMFLFLSLNYTI